MIFAEDGAEIMTEAEIDALLVEIEKKLGQLELCAQRTKSMYILFLVSPSDISFKVFSVFQTP